MAFRQAMMANNKEDDEPGAGFGSKNFKPSVPTQSFEADDRI